MSSLSLTPFHVHLKAFNRIKTLGRGKPSGNQGIPKQREKVKNSNVSSERVSESPTTTGKRDTKRLAQAQTLFFSLDPFPNQSGAGYPTPTPAPHSLTPPTPPRPFQVSLLGQQQLHFIENWL